MTQGSGHHDAWSVWTAAMLAQTAQGAHQERWQQSEHQQQQRQQQQQQQQQQPSFFLNQHPQQPAHFSINQQPWPTQQYHHLHRPDPQPTQTQHSQHPPHQHPSSHRGPQWDWIEQQRHLARISTDRMTSSAGVGSTQAGLAGVEAVGHAAGVAQPNTTSWPDRSMSFTGIMQHHHDPRHGAVPLSDLPVNLQALQGGLQTSRHKPTHGDHAALRVQRQMKHHPGAAATTSQHVASWPSSGHGRGTTDVASFLSISRDPVLQSRPSAVPGAAWLESFVSAEQPGTVSVTRGVTSDQRVACGKPGARQEGVGLASLHASTLPGRTHPTAFRSYEEAQGAGGRLPLLPEFSQALSHGASHTTASAQLAVRQSSASSGQPSIVPQHFSGSRLSVAPPALDHSTETARSAPKLEEQGNFATSPLRAAWPPAPSTPCKAGYGQVPMHTPSSGIMSGPGKDSPAIDGRSAGTVGDGSPHATGAITPATIDPSVIMRIHAHPADQTCGAESNCASSPAASSSADSPDPLNVLSPVKTASTSATTASPGSPLKRRLTSEGTRRVAPAAKRAKSQTEGALSASIVKSSATVLPRATPLPITPTKSADSCYVDIVPLSPPSRGSFTMVVDLPVHPPARAAVASPPQAEAVDDSPMGPRSVFQLTGEDDFLSDEEYDDDEDDFVDAEDDLVLLPLGSDPSSSSSNVNVRRPKAKLANVTRISSGVVKGAMRRPPLQKLADLMSDIFEAEDSLPDLANGEMDANVPIPTTSQRFFHVVEGKAIPRLAVLRGLLRVVWGCTRTARNGQPTVGMSPQKDSGPTSIAQLNLDHIQRLLRILEQAIEVGRNVRPLPALSAVEGSTKAKQAKKGGKRKRRPTRAGSGEPDEEVGATNDVPETATVEAESSGSVSRVQEILSYSDGLDRIAYSVLAADCCLGILGAEGIPASMASEELLGPCLEVVRLALDDAVLPFVEACSGTNPQVHPTLAALVEVLAPPGKKRKKASQSDAQLASAAKASSESLESLFRQSCSAMSQLQKLVVRSSVTLPDSILVGATYAALGPFFAVEPQGAPAASASVDRAKGGAGGAARGRLALQSLGSGGAALKTLRLPALQLLCGIFGRHEDQREWIIQDILGNLIKLPDIRKNRRQHSVRNGSSIHSVTALLLQLVQSTATTGGSRSRSQTPLSTSKHDETRARAEMDDVEEEENRSPLPVESWKRALEDPGRACKAIANFLMLRLDGSGKHFKSAQETSYASIIDILVGDLLTTWCLPEWPASALMLSHMCRTFSAWLEDPKASIDARGVAMEHLGTIATRLREHEMSCLARRHSKHQIDSQLSTGPRPLSADRDVALLGDVSRAYEELLRYLSWARSDDHSAESALHFTLAQWGCEYSTLLACVLEQMESRSADDAPATDKADEALSKQFVAAINRSLTSVTALHAELDAPSANVFATGEEFDYAGLRRSAEDVYMASNFVVRFEWVLQRMVEALDHQPVSVRAKVLRGLTDVGGVDSALLDREAIRSAVELRMSDESVMVREAAVALLGRYLLSRPELVPRHYPSLRARINDAGLAVRKRTLRLLSSIYGAVGDESTRLDACAHVLDCINDEDAGMRDLAIVTLARIWFGLELRLDGRKGREVVLETDLPELASTQRSVSPHRKVSEAPTVEAERASWSDLAAILSRTLASRRERTASLEALISAVLDKCDASQTQQLTTTLRAVNDGLIDRLVEDEGGGDATHRLESIRTVHLITTSNPSVLSIGKAKALLPFLRSAQSPDEWLVTELLLKIFRAALPHMPATAASFAQSLQAALTPMVSRPPRSLAIVQELVAAYCAAIVLHSHDLANLTKAFARCFSALRSRGAKLIDEQATSPVEGAQLVQLMWMTSLLCEHANLDRLRKESTSASLVADIEAIEAGSITSAVSACLLELHRLAPRPFRMPALQCLGFLFRAYPTLMTQDDVTEAMTELMREGTASERETLLNVLLDFFQTEQKRMAPARRSMRKARGEIKVDMEELVGSTDGLADSSVGSAVLQMFLDDVLRAAREVHHAGLQRSAMEILRVAVMQGLSHPLQCVPTLICLETLDKPYIRARALQLHDHLAVKHGSLLSARYLDFARESFRFQLSLAGKAGTAVRGFREDAGSDTPVALLGSWYSLVRDRRQSRLDFLRSLCRAFKSGRSASAKTAENDVLFARYVAENLATLEYKTAEEVFVVVHALHTFLSVAGLQVLHAVDEMSDEEDEASDDESTHAKSINGSRAESCERDVEDDDDVDRQHSREGVEAGGEAAKFLRERLAAGSLATTVSVAVLLRNHLKAVYGLSEARCRKYEPGKKQSAGADRPAVRRGAAAVGGAGGARGALVLPLDKLAGDGEGDAKPTHRLRRVRREMAAAEALLREEGAIRELEEDAEDYEA